MNTTFPIRLVWWNGLTIGVVCWGPGLTKVSERQVSSAGSVTLFTDFIFLSLEQTA